MNNIFTYGTLMDEAIMEAVTGKRFESRDALLRGFARYRVRNEGYPGIVRNEETTVRGKMYLGIDDDAVLKLDAFEGHLYTRAAVNVALVPGGGDVSAGEPGRAFTYVIRERFRHILTSDVWNAEAFERHGKRYFIDKYLK